MSAGRGGRSRGRRRGGHEEEPENHERWLVSYSDMLTVLMGLFIVLYAMSTVDQVKLDQLRQSLAAGFGLEVVQRSNSILDGSDGAMDGSIVTPTTPDLALPANALVGDAEGSTAVELLQAARAEVDRLLAVQEELAARLEAQGMGELVDFRISDRGLVIGLVATDAFFGPSSARLTPTAETVIDAMGPVLAGVPNDLSTEGHANVLDPVGYASNWELSADRATQVLRRLVEVDGVAADKIIAIGFGDAHPVYPEGDDDALAKNRRVDIVVLTGESTEVRELLSRVAASMTEGQ